MPIAILLNTKGTAIRTDDMENGKIFLEKGQKLCLTAEECLGTPSDRAKHLEEIGETQGTFYANPNNLALVMQRKKKYMEKQFKGI